MSSDTPSGAVQLLAGTCVGAADAWPQDLSERKNDELTIQANPGSSTSDS